MPAHSDLMRWLRRRREFRGVHSDREHHRSGQSLGADGPGRAAGSARLPCTSVRTPVRMAGSGWPEPLSPGASGASAARSGMDVREWDGGGDGQGDSHDGAGAGRGALGRLLRPGVRAEGRRPLRLRRLHARLSAQSGERFRGRAHGQQGADASPTSTATATATSRSRSTTSTPSTGASGSSGCSPPRSRSSTATAR